MPAVELENLTRKYGAVTAVDDISLVLSEGEMLAMLGPSGCGKTTTLRMLAGLEHPTSGSIRIGETVLANGRKSVPPEDRGIGMVFQSYALWPHMKVFDNVAYGLKLRKVPKAEIAQRVSNVLAIVDMAPYSDRFPAQLSGGQQQRVALARAIALEPNVLLFDEPLSNLDAALRESMRFEIRHLQQRLGTTSLYVTHSQEEALAMADRIAVMQAGRILQVDRPDEIYHRPTNRFVGKVVGVANFLRGRVSARSSHDVHVMVGESICIRAARSIDTIAMSQDVDVMFRPDAVEISRLGDAKSETPNGENSFVCTVSKISYLGSVVEYFLDIEGVDSAFRVQGRSPVVANISEKVVVSFGDDVPWVMPVMDD
ncbi:MULTISPECIES: ABC transporter ATP-binding protein [Chelativorans]|jgi:iron(III) transport system ATP-binding protein|uniref:ABC transporter related protein n=1 Tax=Chelativorans sp. (strain BNC1) TaxID=266779 RepID=Q11AU2_CHESB|nr:MULTISPECIES: ABC transporter ATP-binding protein [Chelativorans]